MNNKDLKFGVTAAFPCNYLPEENERLIVASDPLLHNNAGYSWLMGQGFRRSGEQIYRPHCEACNACQSVRVIVNEFTPSKSQKRQLKKNAIFTIKIAETVQDNYYPLYELYINTIHTDSSMYPANYEQYATFLISEIAKQCFIEIWHDDKLVSVAVTDILADGLSAVYTFYHPEYRSYGLGVYSILNQIDIAKSYNKHFLYLGYQIDACQKMNYKNRYFPYQKLVDNKWLLINK
jgi:arginyl-tRNA--protein-N-Asp/Glu arginylyltransferase